MHSHAHLIYTAILTSYIVLLHKAPDSSRTAVQNGKQITSQGCSNRTKVLKHITQRPPQYACIGVSRAALNIKRMSRDVLKWHWPSMKQRPSQPDQQPN